MKNFLINFQLSLNTNFKKISFLIIGLIFGFVWAVLVFGKDVGEQGILPNIRIFLYNHEFRLHHWLTFPIYAFLIYLCFKKQKQYIWLIYFVMVFLIGAALQGFTYSDWYVVVK